MNPCNTMCQLRLIKEFSEQKWEYYTHTSDYSNLDSINIMQGQIKYKYITYHKS